MNCSCFAKTNETQGLFDPCACTSQEKYCTTELCLSVDKLKKKKQTTRKTAAWKRLRQCTDVNVYVVYILSRVKTGRTYTIIKTRRFRTDRKTDQRMTTIPTIPSVITRPTSDHQDFPTPTPRPHDRYESVKRVCF